MTEPKTVWDDLDPTANSAYFFRDEDRYVPTAIARGGWGPTVSGHAVGGLLAWAAESAVDDPQLHPARLTVDLPAPMALEPVELLTRVHHERRRLRLVEVVLVQRGATVARGSALFLRRGQQPEGEVWSPPVQMPPLPVEQNGNHPSLLSEPTAGASGCRIQIPIGATRRDRNTHGWRRRVHCSTPNH